jgi:hypothetical protein
MSRITKVCFPDRYPQSSSGLKLKFFLSARLISQTSIKEKGVYKITKKGRFLQKPREQIRMVNKGIGKKVAIVV